MLGELLEDPVGIRVLTVDLVDGHDDRHLGRLGVVDGLDGLGHDTVVRRHHEDDDVGHLGPSRTHSGERLVSWGVDERQRVSLPGHLVGADVLGDATGLASDHVRGSDLVEQQGLAVVDVTHDRDDGRTGLKLALLLILVLFEVLGEDLGLLLLTGVDQAHLGTQLGSEELDHVVGQRLCGGDHLALEEQEPDHVSRRAVQLGAEV